MMALPNRIQYMNTAPNPEITREKRKAQEEESRRLNKSRQEFVKKNATRNNKMKKSAVIAIALVAACLFLTLYRSGMIYNMQNEYVQLQTETRITTKNNEALMAEIIKASSIGEIAEKSLELELVSVDKESRIVADLSKNNFIEDEPVVVNPGFTEKIFSMINLKIFN